MPESREDSWQQEVIAALGLSEWARLEWRSEMDVLGPLATGVLRRVGVLDPFNAFFHDPLCAQVAGGSLLTGVGGDEVLSGPLDGTAFRIRYRRRRPRLSQLGALARSYAPQRLRARRARREHVFSYATWLRPRVKQDLEREYADWMTSGSLAWDASVRQFWASRECQVGLAGLDRVSRDHDVQMIHPLSSADFLSSMIAAHGAAGPGGRSRATEDLVGDLLPRSSTQRADKAAFGGAFWTGSAAEFGVEWSGGGVDDELVDIDALRAEWQGATPPHVGSMLLLHSAWLHDHGGAVSPEA